MAQAHTHKHPRKRTVRVTGQIQEFRRLPPGTIGNKTDYKSSSLLLGEHEMRTGNRSALTMAQGQRSDCYDLPQQSSCHSSQRGDRRQRARA
ncbi:hypothetical protein SUGI_1222060 [Cryptomeria japonica]|uniref:Uncharacterized protein n=1 Tax=Cryptomeria japonica TaxID=3369 RepID=A0AAD3RP98_CRYJA|nr:hypothetical protein SUGI_1222060 [Cryptomeria japonica]